MGNPKARLTMHLRRHWAVIVSTVAVLVSGCGDDVVVTAIPVSVSTTSRGLSTTLETSTSTTGATTSTTTQTTFAPSSELTKAGYVSDDNSPVYGISWSPDSATLAIAGREIRVWDRSTGKVVESFGRAENVCWSVDGTLLAVEYGTSVRVWDASNWELAGGLEFGADVRDVALSPDSTAAVVGLESGALQIWSLIDETIVYGFDHRSMMLSVGWSPAGRFAVGGAWNGTLILLDTETNADDVVTTVTGYSSRRSDVNGMEWAPDGTHLATAHQDGVIRVWDVSASTDRAPEVADSFEVPGGWLAAVAWAPEGNLIAGAGETGLVRVWDVATGEVIAETTSILKPVWALSWSADGHLLAAAGATAQGGGVVIYEAP